MEIRNAFAGNKLGHMTLIALAHKCECSPVTLPVIPRDNRNVPWDVPSKFRIIKFVTVTANVIE